MRRDTWTELRVPTAEEAEVEPISELFHENSKVGQHDGFQPQSDVLGQMQRMHESLPYDTFPSVELPTTRTELKRTLAESILGRVSAHDMKPAPVSLEALGTLLHYAYGITRDNKGTEWPRPFRTVPSGGGLFPLELFFHTTQLTGHPAGLYHYNPGRNRIACLREGDFSKDIAAALVPFQSELAFQTSVIFFLTALFQRSTFKYGPRGYRFALLETGHVAQNLNLVSTAMGLGCLNIGGYFDREMDAFLGLDGVTHSTLYMVGIGERTNGSGG